MDNKMLAETKKKIGDMLKAYTQGGKDKGTSTETTLSFRELAYIYDALMTREDIKIGYVDQTKYIPIEWLESLTTNLNDEYSVEHETVIKIIRDILESWKWYGKHKWFEKIKDKFLTRSYK